ncbi:MAG: hypothetical protein ACTS77_00395 [Arsenophonus sp. NC-TX2-MAG3]
MPCSIALPDTKSSFLYYSDNGSNETNNMLDEDTIGVLIRLDV